MKRILSAAVASAMLLSAAAPAFAADFTKDKRPAKISAQMQPHGMMHHKKAAPTASHFAPVPGRKHFGMAMTTKKQAAHGFAANSIPNLQGKKKVRP